MTVRLSEVIPWGRSFEEYRLMFSLSADDLARVLRVRKEGGRPR